MYFQYLGFPDEVVFTPHEKLVPGINHVYLIVKCRNKCVQCFHHFRGGGGGGVSKNKKCPECPGKSKKMP